MNKKYLIHYRGNNPMLSMEEQAYQQEAPTREEAEEIVEYLQESHYENIIIEEIRI